MTTQIPAFPPGADALQQVGPKRWRKQIFPFGREFMHPKDPKRVLRFTQEFARRMVENFNRGVRDIVPVPAEHSESWQDNHGRVVALEIVPERGVYGVLEVDDEADRAIREKRLAGVSASFAENYTDRETGSRIGPVLRHVALTNGPYIEGMDPFQAAVALSEDDDAADLVFSPLIPPVGLLRRRMVPQRRTVPPSVASWTVTVAPSTVAVCWIVKPQRRPQRRPHALRRKPRTPPSPVCVPDTATSTPTNCRCFAASHGGTEP